MAKYTEEQISRIISDVEILILPETVSYEEIPQVQEVKKVTNPKSAILTRYFEGEVQNSDEYFEDCFNATLRKRQSLEFPTAVNFFEVFGYEEPNQLDKKPNSQRAVNINTELKQQLIRLRNSLEEMRLSVDARLETLEKFLEDAKSNEKDSSNLKISYVKCGAPYFKDAMGFPAPENEDFKFRKNILKEFFPFDMNLHGADWEDKEKSQLLAGIKEQMIRFIQTQQSKKLCLESKKTRGKMQKIRYIFNSKDLSETSIEGLYETIKKEYPEFWNNGINWNLISFNSLDGKHSVSECMGMWHSFLRPDINQDPLLSPDEIETLKRAVVENNYQNWNKIANELNRRTSLQTFILFCRTNSLHECQLNVRWTQDEDQQLLNAVKMYTRGKDILWNKVGAAVSNRSKTQCYNRYLIMMRQKDSKKGVFKPHEDRILLDYVAKHGTDFSKMPPQLLPNRSLVQIQCHYNVALKHKGKINPWTHEEDKILVEFIENEALNNPNGKDDKAKWRTIADRLKTHNRLSCRTRYTTIQKFLRKNKDKTLADVPSRLKTVTAVHKAIQSDEDDLSESEVSSYREGKELRSKTFGALTFDEFKIKNSQLYKLLRTAYNYNLETRPLKIDNVKFHLLMRLLDIDDSAMRNKMTYCLTQGQLRKLKEIMEYNLEPEILAEISYVKTHFEMCLPPNFNTSLGLRAVAIKVNDEAMPQTTAEQNESEDYQAALARFQKLFYSLFYWPAMMSKLQESELRSNYLINDSKNNAIGIVNYVTSGLVYPSTKKFKPEYSKSSI